MNGNIFALLVPCLVVGLFHCAGGSSCQTNYGGVCQDDSSYCPQGYQSNLCPGAVNIKCCLPDITSSCSTKHRGVCQDTSKTCDRSYLDGFCPGSSSYKCCPPDTTTACYMDYEGSCRDDGNGCAGGYAAGSSGLCPGPSNIRCCMNHERISHSDAMAILTAASITVSSSGNCNDRHKRTCTSLDQIRRVSLICLVKFKQASGCSDVRVTGGTETGHATSTYSHWNGWKIDIRLTTCVDSYITQSYTFAFTRSDGSKVYRDSLGYLWAKESNHWDIRFHN